MDEIIEKGTISGIIYLELTFLLFEEKKGGKTPQWWCPPPYYFGEDVIQMHSEHSHTAIKLPAEQLKYGGN